MKVYNSKEYDVMGYDNGQTSNYKGWVLRQKCKHKDFIPETIIVPACKYVYYGTVIFLMENGQMQSNSNLNYKFAWIESPSVM